MSNGFEFLYKGLSNAGTNIGNAITQKAEVQKAFNDKWQDAYLKLQGNIAKARAQGVPSDQLPQLGSIDEFMSNPLQNAQRVTQGLGNSMAIMGKVKAIEAAKKQGLLPEYEFNANELYSNPKAADTILNDFVLPAMGQQKQQQRDYTQQRQQQQLTSGNLTNKTKQYNLNTALPEQEVLKNKRLKAKADRYGSMLDIVKKTGAIQDYPAQENLAQTMTQNKLREEEKKSDYYKKGGKTEFELGIDKKKADILQTKANKQAYEALAAYRTARANDTDISSTDIKKHQFAIKSQKSLIDRYRSEIFKLETYLKKLSPQFYSDTDKAESDIKQYNYKIKNVKDLLNKRKAVLADAKDKLNWMQSEDYKNGVDFDTWNSEYYNQYKYWKKNNSQTGEKTGNHPQTQQNKWEQYKTQ